MKKNYIVRTLVAGTAVTLATVGASTVAADTDQVVNIETGGVTTVENATQVPVESSSTSETAVTATDVQTAGEAVEQAQSAVDTQKVVVESATQAYGTAEEIATQTKEQLTVAEQTAAQATPEAIQEAEAAIDQVKAEQVTKETTIQSATESVKQAQADVAAQEKVVEAAKQATSKKQADVDAAQSKVKEAEAAFDSATLLQAQQEAGRLDALVKEEQSTVSDLTASLAVKEQEQRDLIANGTKKRQELEQAVTNAGPEFFAEVVERELAKHEVSKSDSISTPKTDTVTLNNGKVVPRLVNENLLFAEGEVVETIVLSDKDAYTYDRRRTVDYNKVSKHVRDYLVELRRINGIDIPVPEVTDAALKWAKARTDEMAKNDKLSHDTVLKVKDFGLTGETENATSGGVEQSLLDEKEIAYNLVLSYFNDYRNAVYQWDEKKGLPGLLVYGHRIPLLAASGTGIAVEATKGYGILTFVSDNGQNVYSVMPSTIDPSIRQGISYYLSAVENADSDPLRTEFYFNGKRTKFLPKTTFRYVWEETLYHKNTKREEAINALTNFNTTQEVAEKAIAQTISIINSDLTTAQNTLLTDEKALENATNRVTELTADNAVKVQVLKEAQAELALQQSELKVAKDNQAKEEAKLSNLEGILNKALENLKLAQSDLEQAKQAVQSTEQELLDLQHAQEKLKNAQLAYTRAQQNLEETKAKLESETKILETLQAERDTKQSIYQDLKARYEAAQVILRDLEDKAKDNVIATLPDGTVIAVPKDGLLTQEKPALDINVIKDAIAKGQDITVVDGKVVVDEKKVAVSPVASKPQTSVVTVNKKDTYSRVEQTKTLPNTGAENSIILMGIGVALGGLGLAGVRKRTQG
ncbi:TPA: LPXTG cell wall anchor domain-containing protein [Streptococcus suis]|nr:LPXTG cell wall anchor domain-containing protein [Streptococcus suis]